MSRRALVSRRALMSRGAWRTAPCRARCSSCWSRRRLLSLLLMLLSALALDPLVAQDELRIRRVLVPEERIEEVVRGRGRYLTVDREPLERLLASGGTEGGPDQVASLATAEFYGRYESDGSLRGIGRLQPLMPDADLRGEPVDASEGGRWIEIETPSFWIGRVRWRVGDPSLGGTRTPIGPLPATASTGPSLAGGLLGPTPSPGIFGLPFATLGTSAVARPLAAGIEVPAMAGVLPSGRFGIEASGRGDLALDWIAIGAAADGAPAELRSPAAPLTPSASPAVSARTTIETTLRYDLAFAGAVRTTWYLDLPIGLRPRATGSIVASVERVPIDVEQSGRQLWRIDSGPAGDGSLTIGPDRPVEDESVPGSGVTVAAECELLPGSVELRTSIGWKANGRDELVASIPDGWRFLPPTSADGSSLRFVEDDSPGPRQLRITGLAARGIDRVDLTLQRSYDYGERLDIVLPKFDADWLHGSFSLIRNGQFEIEELALTEAGWTSRGIATDAAAPLQAIPYGPEMRLSIVVRPSRGGLEGIALTAIEAEGGKVSAEFQAWLRPVGAPTFVWRGPLSDGWLVDRVSAIEVGVPDVPWVESWDLTQGDDGRTWLEVRFQQELRGDRELALTVLAHRLSFPGALEPLKVSELRLIDRQAGLERGHSLALVSENPYRFVPIGERRPQRIGTQWDARIAAWAGANPTALLVSLDVDADLEFTLRTETDEQIDVDVEVGAIVFDRSARQRVLIRCRPIGGRPNELTLDWDRPPTGDWEWTLQVPTQDRTLPVRELASEAGDPNERSTLSWGVGLGEPFLLIGTAVESWDRRWRPRIPRLPGARQSTGLLTVASQARSELVCQSDASARLPASVARLAVDERLLTVIDLAAAAFPVTVSRADDPDLGAAVAPATRSDSGRNVIASALLESWPSSSGTRHRLVLTLGDVIPDEIELRPPVGARRADADPEPRGRSANAGRMSSRAGDPNAEAPATPPLLPADEAAPKTESTERRLIETRTDEGGGGTIWRLSLAGRRPGETVEIAFITDDRIPTMLGPIRCPWPESDAEPLTSRWRVHLPGGCEPATRGVAADREDALASWLLARWLGFAVSWRPAFGPLRSDRGIGVERDESRIDPSTVVIGAGSETVLLVRRPEVLRWWCFAAILVQGALWIALLGRRAVAAPFVAAIVALWLPERVVDLGWTIVPGALFAAIVSVRSALTREVPGKGRDANGSRVRRAAVLASSVALLLSIVAAARGFATVAPVQELAAPNSPAPATQTESVEDPEFRPLFVPLDAQGRESLGYVVVPQELYDALLRGAPGSGARRPAWVVESVRHAVETEPNPIDAATRLRLTSRYRVRSLEPRVVWPLPKIGESLAVQADRIQVDAATGRVSGGPDGSLRVQLDEPGVHEVTVTSLELVGSGRERTEWRFPRVPDSEVRVNGIGLQGLTVLEPERWLEPERPGPERRTRPGPLERLAIGTLRSRTAEGTRPTPLGLLELLRPTATGAEMTVWVSAGMREALPDRVRLSISGGWEPIGSIPTEALGERTTRGELIDVTLDTVEGDERETLVGLILRAPESPGPGRWPLPIIRPLDYPIGARHVVWRQPSRAVWSLESSTGTPLTGVDSLATWWSPEQQTLMGVNDGQRQVASRGSAGERLVVRPGETNATVDHQIDLDLTAGRANWSLSSVFSVMRGEVGWMTLDGTLPFDVEQMQLVGADGPVDVAVIRLSSRRLLLVPAEPQRTTFQLTGKGRWRIAPGELLPLPLLRFAEFDDVRTRANFVRSTDVRIDAAGTGEPLFDELRSAGSTGPMVPLATLPANDVEREASEEALFAQRWRDERRAELQGNSAAVRRWSARRFTWQPASYASLERTEVRFRRAADGWSVQVEVLIGADEPWGADRFDVLVPDGFVGQPTEGIGDWERIESGPASPAGLRRWTSRRRMLPGERVVLNGTSSRFPDGRVLPRVLAPTEPPRLVRLPATGTDDPYVWRYDRYRPLTDTEFVSPNDPTTEPRGLRLIEESDAATLRLASKPLVARPSRVFLAEHRIARNPAGATIESRFVLDPGGRSRVRLELPAGMEAIRATIDGEPRGIDDSGSIELTSRELPQDLRIVSFAPDTSFVARRAATVASGEATAESDVTAASLPRLDIRTARTVVAVRPSERMPRWRAADGGRPLTIVEWNRAIVEATEGARGSLATVAGLSPAAMARWNESWIRPTESGQVGASEGRELPLLAIDSNDGSPIWRQGLGGSGTSTTGQSLTIGSGIARRGDMLPRDATAWQVWQWEEGAPAVAPRTDDGRIAAAGLLTLGVMIWGATVGIVIRIRPEAALPLADLTCLAIGLAWTAAVQPVGPGALLVFGGLLPMLIGGWRRASRRGP